MKITGRFGPSGATTTLWYDARETGNLGSASSTATIVTPGATGAFIEMSVTPPPLVTRVIPGSVSNDADAALTITGAALDGVTVAFLVGEGRTIRLADLTAASSTQATATILAGTPAGTYRVLVRGEGGRSERSSATVTVNHVAALPVVERLSQVAVARGSAPTITLRGENLGDAKTVTITPEGSQLTPENVRDDSLDVTLPARLPTGIYQFRVQADNGAAGPLSPSFDVNPAVDPDEAEDNEVITEPLSVSEGKGLSKPLKLSSEGAGGDVETVRTTVDLPPGLAFAAEEGQAMPSDVLPPRPVLAPEVFGAGALAFSLGRPNQGVRLSFPVVTQVDVTAASSTTPRVFVEVAPDQFERAGISGTVDEVAYEPGGVVLSETPIGNGRSQFVVGILVDHFSDFTVSSDKNAPSEPRNARAIPGSGQVTVGWEPPSDSGGGTISDYTVTTIENDTQNVVRSEGVGTSTEATVTGLMNGVDYYFSITATNEFDTGPAATSSAVTPTAGLTASGVVTLDQVDNVGLDQSVIDQRVTEISPTVTILDGTTVVATAAVSGDGSFTTETIAPGSYTVRADANGFLPSERDETLSANLTISQSVTLVIGDVDDNDFINVDDLTAIKNSANFGTEVSRPSGGLFTDLDASGFLNVDDLSAVKNAFNKNGVQPWQ